MDIALLEISNQAAVVLMLLCGAGTKLVDEIVPIRLNGAFKILISVLIGGLASFGLDGVSLLTGLAYGAAMSGLITMVGYTKKTTPVETLG
jgi:hypothetical protein